MSLQRNMATLRQIRDKVDAKLAELWPTIVAKQTSYFTKHGRYFGLLATSETPLDGEDIGASKNIAVTEEHPEDYDFVFPSQLPFQLQVWHHGSLGFTAQVWVRVQGTLYSRIKSYGELDKTHSWFVINEDGI